MIKKIIISFLSLFIFVWFLSFWYADDTCNWIKLNTNVPFVTDWGKCIERDKAEEAFPKLMWWISKIVITLTLVTWFLMLVAWWVLITMSWAEQSNYWKWKELIIKVIVWILLLWASGVILHMINPNFFT